MGISYAEAEGIKIGMPAEVQSNLEPLLTPLGTGIAGLGGFLRASAGPDRQPDLYFRRLGAL